MTNIDQRERMKRKDGNLTARMRLKEGREVKRKRWYYLSKAEVTERVMN